MEEVYPTVPKGEFWPNMCVVCCDRDGPYIDLRTKLAESVGAHGYLCLTCANTIGKAVEMVPLHEVEGLQTALSEMEDEINDLTRQVDALGIAKEVLA